MHYVCIENNVIISILNYEPSVPESVQIISIDNVDAENINNQTHFFDIETRTVKPIASEIIVQLEQEKLNAVRREFLNSTDWKILRHIRQKALNVATSMTDEEYIALEQQRNDTASQII
jgi:hypothetical protein